MPNRKVVNGEQYRYAYQGQEKDPETGKEAFQLRLWDGRIGRWLNPDPYSQFSSPYLGMGNNPVNGIDSDGGIVVFPNEKQANRAKNNLNSLFKKRFNFTQDAFTIKEITYKNRDGKMIKSYKIQANKGAKFEKMLADLNLLGLKKNIWESFKDLLDYKYVIEGELVSSDSPGARERTLIDALPWRDVKIHENKKTTIGQGGTFSSGLFRVNEDLPNFTDNQTSFNIASTILHETLWHLSPMGKNWLKNRVGTAKTLFDILGITQETHYDNIHTEGGFVIDKIKPRSLDYKRGDDY